jgi:sugar phosphate isomerase/epimerase
MRLGIGSWTYGWATGVSGYPLPARPLTAIDLIDRANEHGVAIVQLGDNLPTHKLSPMELALLSDHAAELGIEIELGTVGFEEEHLRRYLELAKILGARLVRTLIRTPGEKPDLADAESSIRSVGEEFRSGGVVLAIENYEKQYCTDLAALVARICNPCVAVCLDTVNSLGALETPREVVAVLGPFVQNLHLKDFTIRRLPSKMGYEVIGCPAGEGRLEIAWILSEMRKYGRNPSVILEQWTPWAGSIESTVAMEEEWASRSISFLKKCD